VLLIGWARAPTEASQRKNVGGWCRAAFEADARRCSGFFKTRPATGEAVRPEGTLDSSNNPFPLISSEEMAAERTRRTRGIQR